jgi:hypothetical protein
VTHILSKNFERCLPCCEGGLANVGVLFDGQILEQEGEKRNVDPFLRQARDNHERLQCPYDSQSNIRNGVPEEWVERRSQDVDR